MRLPEVRKEGKEARKKFVTATVAGSRQTADFGGQVSCNKKVQRKLSEGRWEVDYRDSSSFSFHSTAEFA